MMEKYLIADEEGWKRLLACTSGWKLQFTPEEKDAPKSYPAIFAHREEENPNGRNYLNWEWIYLSDFTELTAW